MKLAFENSITKYPRLNVWHLQKETVKQKYQIIRYNKSKLVIQNVNFSDEEHNNNYSIVIISSFDKVLFTPEGRLKSLPTL